MIIKQTSRTGAENVFIVCRNVSAATLSAGVPVEWDVNVATDGNAVTAAKSASPSGLFAGINDASLADSAYGLVQTYGFRTSAYVSAASAGNAPGTFLQATNGILTDLTMSAATTSGAVFVSLMETVAAAAGSSATLQYNVFIRAM